MNERLRLDKWLWHTRHFKSRGLAASAISTGGIRINGRPAMKPHQMVAVGDVVTLPLGSRIVVVQVLALGLRRGPADEARKLYQELPRVDSTRP